MQHNEQEILQLRFENQQLRLENQQLRERCAKLEAEVAALKTQVRELLEKLNTNSSNSSKAPSQDPFRKSKRKKKTERKQGGQLGHLGHERKLYPLDQVQLLHELKPTVCPNCQSISFCEEIISTDIRQIVELPDAPPQVTQYNIHTCKCGRCGKHVKAEIPSEAQFGFGPRLMGLITSLSGEFRLSKRQVVTLVGKIGGMPDHVHLLVQLSTLDKFSHFIRDVKANSSGWIHEHFSHFKDFAWQEGYGSFSVGYSALEKTRSYIQIQEQHHKTMTFEEEYINAMCEFSFGKLHMKIFS